LFIQISIVIFGISIFHVFYLQTVLTVIEKNGNKFVRLSEFYDLLELNKREYSSFIKRNITNHKIPVQGTDFIEIQPQKNPLGRPRRDYIISLEFMRTLCFEIRSVKCTQVKNWSYRFLNFTVV